MHWFWLLSVIKTVGHSEHLNNFLKAKLQRTPRAFQSIMPVENDGFHLFPHPFGTKGSRDVTPCDSKAVLWDKLNQSQAEIQVVLGA